VTGLFALLTHAQPFWGQLHLLLASFLAPSSVLSAVSGAGADGGEKGPTTYVEPVDAEVARAACAMLLATMFAVRASKNFGGLEQWKRWKQGGLSFRGSVVCVMLIWAVARFGRQGEGTMKRLTAGGRPAYTVEAGRGNDPNLRLLR
jgi:hypothetical protein